LINLLKVHELTKNQESDVYFHPTKY
jgi:hypothetical protein